MSVARPRPRRLLLMAGGFVIWSVAFVALYGGLSVGCEFGWHERYLVGPLTLQRTMLVGLFALSVGAGYGWIAFLARARAGDGEPGRFVDRVAELSGWAALGSTVFSFVAVFGLSSCY